MVYIHHPLFLPCKRRNLYSSDSRSPWPTKSTLLWAGMWSQWPILQRPVHYGHEESRRPPLSSKLWLPATIQAKEKRPSPPNLVIFLPRKFADFRAPWRTNVSTESINRMALQLCLLSPLVLLPNMSTLSICPGVLAIGGFQKSNK